MNLEEIRQEMELRLEFYKLSLKRLKTLGKGSTIRIQSEINDKLPFYNSYVNSIGSSENEILLRKEIEFLERELEKF